MLDPFFHFFESERRVVDPKSPEWNTIFFKEYPRSPRIYLPKPPELRHTLSQAILERKTERKFSDQPLDLVTLSALLFWSAGLVHGPSSFRRPHPSGGSRFPIETYCAIFRGGEVEKGIYHYNVKAHALEKIRAGDAEIVRHALPYDFAREAAAIIMLTCVSDRTLGKYGSLGYKLALLEGGHIGQNIYLTGATLGLGVLSLGGVDDQSAAKALDLGEEEALFYQLAIGWPE